MLGSEALGEKGGRDDERSSETILGGRLGYSTNTDVVVKSSNTGEVVRASHPLLMWSSRQITEY